MKILITDSPDFSKGNVYMQAITGADSPGISPTWGMKSRTFDWLFTGCLHFHTDDVYTFI
ncbi:hypothetical protein [Arcticibacter sp.]|uniref:hypothetical protein n=1 Tax=Arcticibacter sp. TaxID=1872630 RepID=UPI00388F6735